jgi:hypothetical protein
MRNCGKVDPQKREEARRDPKVVQIVRFAIRNRLESKEVPKTQIPKATLSTSTLNSQPSTFNPQPSTFKSQKLNCQPRFELPLSKKVLNGF